MRRLLLMTLALLFVVGCVPALDPQYDKEEVLAVAKAFLSDLNDRRYDDCADRFNELMGAQFDAALLRDAMEGTLDKAGAFLSYQQEVATSAVEGDITYALVVLVAEYENARIQYTVSLDPELAVAGFYYK